MNNATSKGTLEILKAKQAADLTYLNWMLANRKVVSNADIKMARMELRKLDQQIEKEEAAKSE